MCLYAFVDLVLDLFSQIWLMFDVFLVEVLWARSDCVEVFRHPPDRFRICQSQVLYRPISEGFGYKMLQKMGWKDLMFCFAAPWCWNTKLMTYEWFGLVIYNYKRRSWWVSMFGDSLCGKSPRRSMHTRTQRTCFVSGGWRPWQRRKGLGYPVASCKQLLEEPSWDPFLGTFYPFLGGMCSYTPHVHPLVLLVISHVMSWLKKSTTWTPEVVGWSSRGEKFAPQSWGVWFKGC